MEVKRMKMTNREYKLVCRELTERMKDTIITFPRKDNFEGLDLGDTSTISITFVGADIMQILGRIRRGKLK